MPGKNTFIKKLVEHFDKDKECSHYSNECFVVFTGVSLFTFVGGRGKVAEISYPSFDTTDEFNSQDW